MGIVVKEVEVEVVVGIVVEEVGIVTGKQIGRAHV